MNTKRCAIYTRKSTEEGLDQEYNSLHAQRDACESYIKSQAHEGWRLVKKHYDDGGFSGGNLERPAFKELLDDVERGYVDVIVVYKIDRLTRSLMDFSKIIEVLDEAEASFVSVTQHFNTTSSMGRLTLNVLLSFAQFEREITGERIRDKLAAMKRKGMWGGGTPPLGYDVVDKKLVVNEEEAKLINHIFERYVELGNVADIVLGLRAKDIRTKSWVSKKGNQCGGANFQRGPIYHILKNHLYIGQIQYKGEVYEGEHKAIVSQELWEKVQAGLADNRKVHTNKRRDKDSTLLEGIIFDSKGNRMTPTFSQKKKKLRYSYYASQPLVGYRKPDDKNLMRIPAPAVEEIITDRARKLTDAPASAIFTNDEIRRIVKRVTIYKDFIELEVYHGLANVDFQRLAGNDDEITHRPDDTLIRIRATLRLRDQQLVFIDSNGYSPVKTNTPDAKLIKNIAKAHRWTNLIESGQFSSIRQLAKAEKCSEGYMRRILPLAYLAPDIIESILDGNQPPRLNLQYCTTRELPYSWDEQRKLLGYTA